MLTIDLKLTYMASLDSFNGTARLQVKWTIEIKLIRSGFEELKFVHWQERQGLVVLDIIYDSAYMLGTRKSFSLACQSTYIRL